LDWIKNIIEAAKLPTKFILCIFAVSIALIFLPENLLISSHLKEFADKYGIYIGITALVSGSLLFTEAVIYIWNLIRNTVNKRKIDKMALERIKNLDPAEKAVLREFFLQGRNTIKLPMDHPVIAGLLHNGILQLVGTHGRMSLAGMLFNMKMSDLVREHLTYEIIELPKGQPTQEDIEFLRQNRPEFISSIEREDSIFNW